MDHTYAVARVRAMEAGLLTEAEFEQLINAADYDEAERLVRDRDLGGAAERLRDMDIPEPIMRVIGIPADYHNIKAAVKSVFSGTDAADLFISGGTADADEIYEAVKKREYGELDPALARTAQEAMTLILQTQDGQLCDMHIDKAMLAALEAAADETGDGFIKGFAALKADIANLKTAMRCALMDKSLTFTEQALYDGGSLDHEALARSASEGTEALKGFVSGTGFSELSEYITSDPAAFEKGCDDRLTGYMDKAKYESFTPAPILAYAHARERERQAVGLVLSAKQSHIDNDIIRERVRRLYV